MQHDITLHLEDEAATIRAGNLFAQCLGAGLKIFLRGNLGAGKTTFTRGLLQALGFQGRVKSPTYTLVETYTITDLLIYHFDFYRFNDDEEWESAGFRDYFNSRSICLVEWPEKAEKLLPEADIEVHILPSGNAREMRLLAKSEIGQACLKRFKSLF